MADYSGAYERHYTETELAQQRAKAEEKERVKWEEGWDDNRCMACGVDVRNSVKPVYDEMDWHQIHRIKCMWTPRKKKVIYVYE